eukprot:3323025-Pleurochrysis_carterae.AAC.1
MSSACRGCERPTSVRSSIACARISRTETQKDTEATEAVLRKKCANACCVCAPACGCVRVAACVCACKR